MYGLYDKSPAERVSPCYYSDYNGKLSSYFSVLCRFAVTSYTPTPGILKITSFDPLYFI